MKNKIIVISMISFLGFFCVPQKVSAQIPVTDGAHIGTNIAEWLKNIYEWKKQFSEMIDAQELRESLQSISQLNQLQSLVELAELLDDVACLSSEFNYYVNIGSNYNCLKFLNFQKITVNMELSMDLLFKVSTVSNYFTMNSEGRMSFVTQVREAVDAASRDMQEFNEQVRRSVIAKSLLTHSKKTYYSGSFTAYNRYK